MSAVAARGARSVVWPILFALPVFCLLVGLGVWQLQRLEWKEGVIASIEGRTHAAPIPLPPSSQWAALAAGDFDYTHVAATGRFEPREALIFRGSGAVAGEGSQPGYWVMAPFRLADGGALLVNRGFVPARLKDDPRRLASLPEGETSIAGLLRAPEDRNPFTPADAPEKGEWYTRDPRAIAAALKLEGAAPFSLDEDPHPAEKGLPAGGATVFDIPNNHLSYAATWFGLAAALAMVLAMFLGKRGRG